MCVYSYDMGIDMAFSFTQFFHGGGWYPWGEPMKEPFTISAKKLNRILQRPDAESKYWKKCFIFERFRAIGRQNWTKTAQKWPKMQFCEKTSDFQQDEKDFWEITRGLKIIMRIGLSHVKI